jgi:hypothetical protein
MDNGYDVRPSMQRRSWLAGIFCGGSGVYVAEWLKIGLRL